MTKHRPRLPIKEDRINKYWIVQKSCFESNEVERRRSVATRAIGEIINLSRPSAPPWGTRGGREESNFVLLFRLLNINFNYRKHPHHVNAYRPCVLPHSLSQAT